MVGPGDNRGRGERGERGKVVRRVERARREWRIWWSGGGVSRGGLRARAGSRGGVGETIPRRSRSTSRRQHCGPRVSQFVSDHLRAFVSTLVDLPSSSRGWTCPHPLSAYPTPKIFYCCRRVVSARTGSDAFVPAFIRWFRAFSLVPSNNRK